jgi:hypothetical protein
VCIWCVVSGTKAIFIKFRIPYRRYYYSAVNCVHKSDLGFRLSNPHTALNLRDGTQNITVEKKRSENTSLFISCNNLSLVSLSFRQITKRSRNAL